MEKLKLSQLSDNVEVSIEESSTVYTVAKLKREIIELGEPHHESSNWYTVVRRKWEPSAESMIDTYLENESCDLYEDFNSVAMDEMPKEAIEKIQSILDEVFKNNSVCDYWTYDKPVEIDIFPKEFNLPTVSQIFEELEKDESEEAQKILNYYNEEIKDKD
ncbi:MAG: hypothetical protein Q8934_08780 [Bacillota bacterium]|nr:hypothetical protein [Bacillota bacterium]